MTKNEDMVEIPATLTPQSHDAYLSVSGGEPLIFHCHHYNIVLQQSIEDAAAQLGGEEFLREAAAIVAFEQLNESFGKIDVEERLKIVSEIFRVQGFGLLKFETMNEQGGVATLKDSHYGLGFASRTPRRKTPACFFPTGFIEGALGAIYGGGAGAYSAQETSCVAVSGGDCRIEIHRRAEPQELSRSPGVGGVPKSLPERNPLASNIDEDAILAALATLPLVGDDEGQIPAFGVLLTRHYANYYNRISCELLTRLQDKADFLKEAAREVLREAGHVCAFNTFGGIMESPEWEGLIQPMIKERSDWVSGIVACINALGWGRWTVTSLDEGKSLTVRVDGSYESNYFRAACKIDDAPQCHFCCGAVAGIMNLLYIGDITHAPELSPEYYKTLFSGPKSFRARETQCRSQGHEYCEFVATPQSY